MLHRYYSRVLAHEEGTFKLSICSFFQYFLVKTVRIYRPDIFFDRRAAHSLFICRILFVVTAIVDWHFSTRWYIRAPGAFYGSIDGSPWSLHEKVSFRVCQTTSRYRRPTGHEVRSVFGSVTVLKTIYFYFYILCQMFFLLSSYRVYLSSRARPAPTKLQPLRFLQPPPLQSLFFVIKCPGALFLMKSPHDHDMLCTVRIARGSFALLKKMGFFR